MVYVMDVLLLIVENVNSLIGSGAASFSKNSTTSGGGGRVAVTKRKCSVFTLERKLEIISEVKAVRQ